MKKFLVAGVAGLMLMAVAGTQTAMAAPWRGAYRGHVDVRPVHRTVYAHPYRHFGPIYHGPVFRNYCY
jgi:hypothetical protein